MIAYTFIPFLHRVNTNSITMFNTSILQPLLVSIGLEIQDILEQLIKLTPSSSMMLKSAALSRRAPSTSLIQLFGRLVPVSLVGKSWVSSHQVLTDPM